MPITPINMAEAVIEPFWDSQLSELSQWAVTPGEAHGLRVWQNWCWVMFEWAKSSPGAAALRMSRTFDLDCGDYDHLVVSAMLPSECTLSVSLQTDGESVDWRSEPAPREYKVEYAVPLRGARQLRRVTMEMKSPWAR